MNYSKITTIIDLITIEVSCKFFENLRNHVSKFVAIFLPHTVDII
jgi:hypothetical protein